jgi:hypothetical protein
MTKRGKQTNQIKTILPDLIRHLSAICNDPANGKQTPARWPGTMASMGKKT